MPEPDCEPSSAAELCGFEVTPSMAAAAAATAPMAPSAMADTTACRIGRALCRARAPGDPAAEPLPDLDFAYRGNFALPGAVDAGADGDEAGPAGRGRVGGRVAKRPEAVCTKVGSGSGRQSSPRCGCAMPEPTGTASTGSEPCGGRTLSAQLPLARKSSSASGTRGRGRGPWRCGRLGSVAGVGFWAAGVAICGRRRMLEVGIGAGRGVCAAAGADAVAAACAAADTEVCCSADTL